MFLWAYCVLGPGGSFPGRYDITLFLSPSPLEQVFMLHDAVVGLWLDHEYCDYTTSAVPYAWGSGCHQFTRPFGRVNFFTVPLCG